MKRSADKSRASPVLAVIALALAGLLALVTAERTWIGYVPSADIPRSDFP
jgi:predicted DNA-binding transcriptional regulator